MGKSKRLSEQVVALDISFGTFVEVLEDRFNSLDDQLITISLDMSEARSIIESFAIQAHSLQELVKKLSDDAVNMSTSYKILLEERDMLKRQLFCKE